MGLLPTSKHRAASHDEGAGHDADGHLGKPATAKGRSLLLMALLLGLASLIILIVGVALIQHRSSNLRGTGSLSYTEMMQSAHYTPYGNKHSRQWQLLWWIIVGSAFIWLMTFLLGLRAVRIHQWHAALVGLHIYFLVLCTFAIDTFLFLDHNALARSLWGHSRLRLVLAGLIPLAVAHALAVLALGMIPSARHIDARHVGRLGGNTATNERIVEVPVPQPAATSVQPETNRGSNFDPRNIDNATATTAGKHYTVGDHPVRVHQGAAYPHGSR